MEHKDAYQEYCTEHPEELKGIRILKARSEVIEIERHKRRMDKLAYIEQCRRILHGKKHSLI